MNIFLKYLNTFIVTNANDCSNLLSYGATFRIGALLPNYPKENIMKGENAPNFKMNTGTSDGTSNIFQILQDLQQKQYQYNPNSAQYGAYNEYRWHSQRLLSGPPHQLQQQNRSIQYRYTKILHGLDLQHTAHMSTNLQFQSANQVNC